MRIKLRPYHPTWVISLFGQESMPEGKNIEGFIEVMDKIRLNSDLQVKFVEDFDDICKKCNEHVEDDNGSVWGEKHSCSSSNNPDMVKTLNETNKRILKVYGLQFGSVITWKKIVKILYERLPVLGDPELGRQQMYEKGLDKLSYLYKLSLTNHKIISLY